jgi:Flp pilus assembly pilin Flp
MPKWLLALWLGEDGATAIEYALLMSLIAGVIAGTVRALGQGLSGAFGSVLPGP